MEGTRCPICQSEAITLGDNQICVVVAGTGFTDRLPQGYIFSTAHPASLVHQKEVPSLIPGTSSRPADIYLPNRKRDQPIALDVTVISSLQQLILTGVTSTQGHALSVARERQLAGHSVGVSFTPMVVESLEGWDEEGASNIRTIRPSAGPMPVSPPL